MNAFYHRDVYPPTDAATIYIDGVLRRLSDDFDVVLFTYSDAKGVHLSEISENYRVCQVPRIRLPIISRLAASPKAKRFHDAAVSIDPRIYFVSEKIHDAEYFLCFESYCALWVGVLSRMKGKKFILRANDCILSLGTQFLRSSELVGPFVVVYGAILEKVISRLAHLILVPSKRTELLFKKHHGIKNSKLFVTPVGYDEKHYMVETQELRETIRKNHHVEEDDFLVVFVGNADWIPNQIALDYIGNNLGPFLSEKVPDARILVIGKNTELFKHTGTENIETLGWVDDIVPYLLAADLGIAPITSMGGISAKTAEYLMSGLPVVATPQVVETIGQRTGVFEEDIKLFHLAVAEKAKKIPQLRNLRGRIQREAVENFSWSKIGPELSSFLVSYFSVSEMV